MPDLYRPCPATGCDHQETVPADAEPEGADDPSYADLWDHVSTAHADGSARITGDLMATVQVTERANPGDTKPGDCPICGPVGGCTCPKTQVSVMRDGEWVDVPGIASVEIGMDPEPEPEPDDDRVLPHPRATLAQRLIDRHDMDPLDAALAVWNFMRGIDGPHTELVRAEGRELLAEIFAPMTKALQELMAAVAPAFKAAVEAVQRASTAVQSDYVLVSAAKTRDRPAWQSPHGPAQKGHRR